MADSMAGDHSGEGATLISSHNNCIRDKMLLFMFRQCTPMLAAAANHLAGRSTTPPRCHRRDSAQEETPERENAEPQVGFESIRPAAVHILLGLPAEVGLVRVRGFHVRSFGAGEESDGATHCGRNGHHASHGKDRPLHACQGINRHK